MIEVPFEFRPARFKDADINDLISAYWVRLYLIYDGDRTFTFYHEQDWLENSALMTEMGHSYHSFYKDVLVSARHFRSIYSAIQDYVSQSNINQKC